MTGFLEVLSQWVGELWPFRRVKLYERALYTVCGRWQWEIGPGVYAVVPWFCEVDAEPMTKGIVGTPRIDITLKDGRLLCCAASAVVRVVDLRKAINNVDHFMESAQELLHAVIADKLSDVEADRLDPAGRRRLLSDLKRWVNEQAADFGVEFDQLRFTTFVMNPRPYRVLSDGAPVASW